MVYIRVKFVESSLCLQFAHFNPYHFELFQHEHGIPVAVWGVININELLHHRVSTIVI